MLLLFKRSLAIAGFLAVLLPAAAQTPADHFTMQQVLGYPFPTELMASDSGKTIAWVLDERGVRNIWIAQAPDFKPRQLTHYRNDDGQELTYVQVSGDDHYVVYVRGGNHDNIYPMRVPPDPTSSIKRPTMQIWAAPIAGGAPILIGQGDAPAVSPDGKTIAFLKKDHSVWSAPSDGSAKPQLMFFDRGADYSLRWSPDGKQLAFVSGRGDHSFITVYTQGEPRLRYLDPTTNHDSDPRWSPNGNRIAFVRRPGAGGEVEPLLKRTPHPWSIWVADVASGKARAVWKSPHTLLGSRPDTAGGANLHWAAGKRLIFMNDLDGWPHLYAIAATGGKAQRLTNGRYMVENVTMSPGGRFIVYGANTGDMRGDIDRRHLFRVAVDGGKPRALTHGPELSWSPVVVNGGKTLAFIQAGAKQPPLVAVESANGGPATVLDADQIPADFPTQQLVVPKLVTFKASDGHIAYGQLFERAGGATKKPGVIFVHGGPMRQMLLGWHYSGYYSNGYAVNQYLANHGFVVLSVNYRLGIGHGWEFHHPAHAGPAGASEYRDVVAGAGYLQHLPGVDAQHIGIWGGSYGGYLTALSLARNSDIFKAGSDWAGIHDWSLDMLRNWFQRDYPSFETDRKKALKVAWRSSPVGAIEKWRSPVLLIQGDNDHTVKFQQTVDIANRLKARGVEVQELVIPDEIHSFLRYHSWLEADTRTAEFLAEKLDANAAR
ncbi:MAG TPA: prolyl oligopeptidase family serine peptidase [Gammaproteobacteria bacterium]|nr:prolyl oligopeptidase family serine peptidase [Gammaproteobacteria bacterium]